MAKMQVFYNQIQGPFKKGEDLVPRMTAIPEKGFLGFPRKIGIILPAYHSVTINGMEFKVEKMETLELNNVEIRSLAFNQDEDFNVSIDYLIHHYSI